MGLTFSQSIIPQEKKTVGRNDPCWCGSRKKYKKCCFFVDEESQNSQYIQANSGIEKKERISPIVHWMADQSWGKWLVCFKSKPT